MNPMLNLKKLLSDQHLFSSCIKTFSPQELSCAKTFFADNTVHFVTNVRSARKLPVTQIPEVCFFGHSNVGKSSLLDALLSQCKNSSTLNVGISKRAGFTKSINYYSIGSKLSLVDLPGYGLKAPTSLKHVVEPYLSLYRQNQKLLCLLIDSNGRLDIHDFEVMEILNVMKVQCYFISSV